VCAWPPVISTNISLPWCVCECRSNWAAERGGTKPSLNLNLWTHSLLHLGYTTVNLTSWVLSLDSVTSCLSLVADMVPAIPSPDYQWMSHLAWVHQLFNIAICCYLGTNEEMLTATYSYIHSIMNYIHQEIMHSIIALQVNFISVTSLPTIPENQSQGHSQGFGLFGK
jgi:hypothetical protein